MTRSGIVQVAQEIANSEFVVFIDDFHYMSRNLQFEVTKQIKAAAELGIKICVASVPHRSDDVVRANPELRGRVQAIDMEYWNEEELIAIGEAGFPMLNIEISRDQIQQLAKEACGSPQLMQSLCLQACFRLQIYESLYSLEVRTICPEDFRRILEATASQGDFSTLVENMHQGPKRRGQDRKEYEFTDGSIGDVYRCILLAVAAGPPVMSIPYSELISRVQKTCISQYPVGSSVSEACSQIDKIAGQAPQSESAIRSAKPIEWDTSSAVETIHIAEPYFLFYLRASNKLNDLGKRK